MLLELAPGVRGSVENDFWRDLVAETDPWRGAKRIVEAIGEAC